VTFAIALLGVFGFALMDIIRDNVGGSWPYMAEYGIVGWALIMSVQLAHDVRDNTHTLGKAIDQVETQARQLTAMLEALRALEQEMQRPLETLESGVVGLARESTAVDSQLRRVERAVTRVKDLARSMPESRAVAIRRAS
jgi:chromosome segregation ATPase